MSLRVDQSCLAAAEDCAPPSLACAPWPCLLQRGFGDTQASCHLAALQEIQKDAGKPHPRWAQSSGCGFHMLSHSGSWAANKKGEGRAGSCHSLHSHMMGLQCTKNVPGSGMTSSQQAHIVSWVPGTMQVSRDRVTTPCLQEPGLSDSSSFPPKNCWGF